MEARKLMEEEEEQKTFLVDQLIHAYVNVSVQFNSPSDKEVKTSVLSPVPSDQSIGRKWQRWGVGIMLGEGYSTKFYTGRLPQGPTPYSFIFHFFCRKVHLTFTSYE